MTSFYIEYDTTAWDITVSDKISNKKLIKTVTEKVPSSGTLESRTSITLNFISIGQATDLIRDFNIVNL